MHHAGVTAVHQHTPPHALHDTQHTCTLLTHRTSVIACGRCSAHIKLAPLVMHHETIAAQQLAAVAGRHYLDGVSGHLFQMLGSLEALGNPVGLFRGVTQVSNLQFSRPLLA
jgi:Vacuolar-sorting-associated 13 protein C-terminal